MTDQTPIQPPADSELSPARVWDMITRIDIAMLVTSAHDGPHGRPMSTIPTPDKGVIYALTESTSSAARHIRVNGAVFLSYQGRGDHVALRGSATVVEDQALVKSLWNPGAQIFWPQGPEGHDVVALVIDPGAADVWDGHGLLKGVVNAVKAVVGGQPPDLGARARVDL